MFFGKGWILATIVDKENYEIFGQLKWSNLAFSQCIKKFFFIFLNFMAPFYGWGSTASRLQLLRGGSLLFTISHTP